MHRTLLSLLLLLLLNYFMYMFHICMINGIIIKDEDEEVRVFGYEQSWPPVSLVINPCAHYIWDHLKHHVN